MTNYHTRGQLKLNAKKALNNRMTDGVALFLFPAALITGISFFDMVGFPALGILISLPITLMLISARFKALDWYRNPYLQFQPIISSFEKFRNPDWWKIISLSLVTGFFTYLWMLLLVIPGIIKAISYSQALYIYKDLSDKGQAGGYTITDFITRSRKLMDGHKADYFVLQLSFLGWFILGCITLGIGFIWIAPYYELTMSGFYDDLVKNNKKIA